MQTEVKARPELTIYPEMPPVARELQLTRDFLASHRWGRDQYENRGRYCVLGAHHEANLAKSYNSYGFSDRAISFWFQATSVDQSPAGYSPTGFNDFIAKSKADVLAALGRAVALALAAGE